MPAPDPFRPEPVPEPEPPLPLPEPPEPQPQPEPEPEPEPEERAAASARQSELESMERALEQERSRVDTWVRSQSEELRAKEETLAGREKELFSKQQEVEAQTRAATERLVALAWLRRHAGTATRWLETKLEKAPRVLRRPGKIFAGLYALTVGLRY